MNDYVGSILDIWNIVAWYLRINLDMYINVEDKEAVIGEAMIDFFGQIDKHFVASHAPGGKFIEYITPDYDSPEYFKVIRDIYKAAGSYSANILPVNKTNTRVLERVTGASYMLVNYRFMSNLLRNIMAKPVTETSKQHLVEYYLNESAFELPPNTDPIDLIVYKEGSKK